MNKFHWVFGLFLVIAHGDCFQNKSTEHNDKDVESKKLAFSLGSIKKGLNTFIVPGKSELGGSSLQNQVSAIMKNFSNWQPVNLGQIPILQNLENQLNNLLNPTNLGNSLGTQGQLNISLKPTTQNQHLISELLKPSKQDETTKRPKPSNHDIPTNVAKEGLEVHNRLRATSPHYGTKLVLDEKLCKDAQRFADQLAARDSGLQHAKTDQGENLSTRVLGWGKVTAEDVVEGWYNERVTGGACMGHYTQLVWKSSKKFCMAMAVSKSKRVYFVARYYPRGNYAGAKNYKENVHPQFEDPCPMFGSLELDQNTPRPSIVPLKPTPQKPATQEPKPSTQKPKPITQKPKPTTQKPKPTTQQSKPTTQNPTLTTQKPKPTTQKPKPTTQRPTFTTQKPKPTTQQTKPSTEKSKPTTQKSKPTTRKPKPTTQQAKPTTQKPQPTTKKPSITTKKPSITTPKPAPPRPSTLTPKPAIGEQSTPRPSVQPTQSGYSQFAQEGLESHNSRRMTSPHYGTLLELDEKLCQGAQAYADTLAKRDSGLQHSKRSSRRGQGENLAYQMGMGKVKAEFATKNWYNEKDTGEQCMGHYTAVVWKSSKKFCMAFAVSKSGAYYTVARYSPPGNVNGQKNYRKNVHPTFVKPC